MQSVHRVPGNSNEEVDRSIEEYYGERRTNTLETFPPASKWSWSQNKGVLSLMVDSIPFASFKFHIIAFVNSQMEWKWVWEDRNNILDRRMYPCGLRKRLFSNKKYKSALQQHSFTPLLQAKDPRIMCSLHAMKGEWFAYLVDKTGVNVAILTSTLKRY
jgi:hypothetical protein